jgi:hypothetical protein
MLDPREAQHFVYQWQCLLHPLPIIIDDSANSSFSIYTVWPHLQLVDESPPA